MCLQGAGLGKHFSSTFSLMNPTFPSLQASSAPLNVKEILPAVLIGVFSCDATENPLSLVTKLMPEAFCCSQTSLKKQFDRLSLRLHAMLSPCHVFMVFDLVL